MSKKELWARIRVQKEREAEKRKSDWLMANLRELADYVECGELCWLRERALHSIRYLVKVAKKENPGFQLPWFVYSI